jgi:SAM-dependent methyltransferase
VKPLTELFKSLFSALKSAGYVWEAVTPERLQALRKAPETAASYGPLVSFFGAGLPESIELREELSLYGMNEDEISALLALRPAITRVGELWIPHSHWGISGGISGGAGAFSDYVHLGPESLELAQDLPRELSDARVLDLGSGSGVHSMLCARNGALATLGLEISPRAVEWATAAARAQGLPSNFKALRIGSSEADAAVAGTPWNLAISNPPLAVPSPGEARPHRDGGRLGIELPMLFLDFAARHLETGGDALFTITNPIVGGRSAFFDRLDLKRWQVVEKRRLTDRFNASLHRKEGYTELGIESIELWFLHLKLLAKKR